MCLFKRIFSVLPVVVLLFTGSCSGDERLDGKRSPVFSSEEIIELSDNVRNVTFISRHENAGTNWYGDSHFLNKEIENYAFDGDILRIKKIKTKPKFKGVSNIVVDDVLYEMRGNSKLYVFNIVDGKHKKLWKKKIRSSDNEVRNARISYYNDKVFVATGFDEIIALSAQNGQELWRKKLKSVTSSVPVPDLNGHLYVTTNDNRLYSLDQNTGEIFWIHSDIDVKTAILGSANPVVYKQYVIVSYSSGNLYVLNRQNGREYFSVDLNLPKITNFTLNDIDATPIVKNGVLYTSGNGGLLTAVSMENFEVLWKQEFPTITDFWVSGDCVYIINNEAKMACIKKSTGDFVWLTSLLTHKDKKKEDRIVYREIVMADDFLLVSNNYGRVIIINPVDGVILGEIKNERNIPIVLFTRFAK